MIPLAAVTPACNSGTSRERMSITDVIENIDRLNGRTVRVAGYLGVCAGYECRLYMNRSDERQWTAWIDEIRRAGPGRRATRTSEPPALGIGPGENGDFDAKAEPFQQSYVVITGRVTNQCRFNGQPDCTDRSTDLIPSAIAGWSGHP